MIKPDKLGLTPVQSEAEAAGLDVKRVGGQRIVAQEGGTELKQVGDKMEFLCFICNPYQYSLFRLFLYSRIKTGESRYSGFYASK